MSLKAAPQNKAPDNGVASAAQECDSYGLLLHVQLWPCAIGWSAMHFEWRHGCIFAGTGWQL
jgi:hypothetical protein